MVKEEVTQKGINGAFICYNQACVSVHNNRNVQTRDIDSAMAIGLSSLATILFNQTFPPIRNNTRVNPMLISEIKSTPSLQEAGLGLEAHPIL